MSGLIPSDPHELAAILAGLDRLPKAPARSAREDDEFLAWIKANAHQEGQAARVAQVRSDLVEILGDRLDTEKAAEMAGYQLSTSRMQRYAADIAKFRSWCAEVGVSHLPAAPEVVAMFILEACGEDPDPAQAARLCRAIRLRHLLAEHLDPTNNNFVRAVRQWIKKGVLRAPEPAAAIPPDSGLH